MLEKPHSSANLSPFEDRVVPLTRRAGAIFGSMVSATGWLWSVSEDICLFASSSVNSDNLVSLWCTSLFEEGWTLKLVELAFVLSWAMLDKNTSPAFIPCFGCLLASHFNTLDLITFYPSS